MFFNVVNYALILVLLPIAGVPDRWPLRPMKVLVLSSGLGGSAPRWCSESVPCFGCYCIDLACTSPGISKKVSFFFYYYYYYLLVIALNVFIISSSLLWHRCLLLIIFLAASEHRGSLFISENAAVKAGVIQTCPILSFPL